MHSSIKLLTQLKTITFWLFDSEKKFSDLLRVSEIPGDPSRASILSREFKRDELVITAHVFYPEYVDIFCGMLSKLSREIGVLITTPSQEIKKAFESQLKDLGIVNKVFLSSNRGRNFGPLFVELSKEILRYKSFVHVHSKRSDHTSKSIASDWTDRQLSCLLTPSGVSELAALFDSKVADLAYADSTALIRGINFRWGINRQIGRTIAAKLGILTRLKFEGRIHFPAGGMFWATTEAVKEILNYPWNYHDFPLERNQVDGTTQHALERLIGVLVTGKQLNHAVFSQSGHYILISDSNVSKTNQH